MHNLLNQLFFRDNLYIWAIYSRRVRSHEGADPSVQTDIIGTLSRLIPKDPQYRHAEGNSDAHLKASLFGFSEQILIDNNRLVLGTWQGVYFCEFDGPRSRKLIVSVQSFDKN